MRALLPSKSSRVLTAVLLLQCALFYGFSRTELAPRPRPLSQFSIDSGNWRKVRDYQMDQETLDVLKADELLSASFAQTGAGPQVELLVAYFQTQRTGKAPHSPKNCLPGSGFYALQNTTIEIPINGEAKPIRVNKYIVARGDNQSLVLYWYQSRSRVVASEYMAKVYTMWDAVRANRTDTALVRVVVPVQHGDTRAAEDSAVSFVRDLFEPLKHYLPA
jgi:EpsI family protein